MTRAAEQDLAGTRTRWWATGAGRRRALAVLLVWASLGALVATSVHQARPAAAADCGAPPSPADPVAYADVVRDSLNLTTSDVSDDQLETVLRSPHGLFFAKAAAMIRFGRYAERYDTASLCAISNLVIARFGGDARSLLLNAVSTAIGLEFGPGWSDLTDLAVGVYDASATFDSDSIVGAFVVVASAAKYRQLYLYYAGERDIDRDHADVEQEMLDTFDTPGDDGQSLLGYVMGLRGQAGDYPAFFRDLSQTYDAVTLAKSSHQILALHHALVALAKARETYVSGPPQLAFVAQPSGSVVVNTGSADVTGLALLGPDGRMLEPPRS